MQIENQSKLALFDALGYRPHAGQVSLHNLVDEYPVVTATCGRRFGKTYSAIYEGIYQALQEGDRTGPPVIYVVSDTYSHSRKIFLPIVHHFENNPLLKRFLSKVYRKDQIITLKGGAEIYAKSADTPQSLAGDSVSFAIIDEAGYVSDEAIDVLRPAFAAREFPKRMNVGTPDVNTSFFKKEFDLGLSDNPEYSSLVLPSSVNPLVSESYLKREQAQHSEAYFRRMYLAEFSSVEGAPFAQIIDKVEIAHGSQDPIAGHRYVAGVDLADRQDYTAVAIVDITVKPNRVVHISSWNGIGYENTGERVADLLRKYNNAYAYVDRTGVGDAAIKFITRHYGSVKPIVFSLTSKMSMHDVIYTAIEKGNLLLYDDPKLLAELRNIRAIVRTKGISYEAPKGLHDDLAMALYLAGHGLNKKQAIPRGFKLGGYRTSV